MTDICSENYAERFNRMCDEIAKLLAPNSKKLSEESEACLLETFLFCLNI